MKKQVVKRVLGFGMMLALTVTGTMGQAGSVNVFAAEVGENTQEAETEEKAGEASKASSENS